MSVDISPRVSARPWPPPSIDELRTATRSRFERQRTGEWATVDVDRGEVVERHRELTARQAVAVRATLADEFGISLATVRRILIEAGVA